MEAHRGSDLEYAPDLGAERGVDLQCCVYLPYLLKAK